MRVIIISADNKRYNLLWNKKIKNLLKSNFNYVDNFHYKYWEDFSQEVVDLNSELRSLIRLIKDKNDYIICAKTVGVLLTLKGIYEKKIFPKQCIFIGIPIFWARINNFRIDKWIDSFNDIPALIIQKEEDPSIYYDDLKKYLKEKNIENIEIQKISGKDMYYEDYDILNSIINDYVHEKISL